MVYSYKPVVVDSALSLDSIRILLEGQHDMTTSTTGRKRRKTTTWPGVLQVDTHLNGCFAGVVDVVSRGTGRQDYTLSEALVQSLVLPADWLRIQQLVQSLVQKNSGAIRCKWTAHLMVCRPGASCQAFHCDDDESPFYFTLIFPLTHDVPEVTGYTQFEPPVEVSPPPTPTQCLIFDGKTSHRGLGNFSDVPRVFFYISLYEEGDGNLAVAGSESLRDEKLVELKKYWVDEELGYVRVGQVWEFIPEPPTAPSYVGIIEEILRNKRKKSVMLEVRWLYADHDILNFDIDVKENELLLSEHFDEIDVNSLSRKVSVSFFTNPNSAEKYISSTKCTANYICCQVYDHKKKNVDNSTEAKDALKRLKKKFVRDD